MNTYLELSQMTGLFSHEFTLFQDDFEDGISPESDSLQSESMLSEFEAAIEAPQALAAYELDHLSYE